MGVAIDSENGQRRPIPATAVLLLPGVNSGGCSISFNPRHDIDLYKIVKAGAQTKLEGSGPVLRPPSRDFEWLFAIADRSQISGVLRRISDTIDPKLDSVFRISTLPPIHSFKLATCPLVRILSLLAISKCPRLSVCAVFAQSPVFMFYGVTKGTHYIWTRARNVS
ncbi:uncharacterized protein LACBIDRAFT_328121 [Laccaria bicolor S238N-H82]|uniref:Predicted protein n=1 Tax=Laccaria bicolor (strain S238N-H82 / ATCC MYA-4686) TaxID=486041 RepID=B0DDU0_LACBS|nr:uncharacterized protein LACBIDRAFT_328121 [Laccaria bicolor S238N-H82]EDR07275.1 predicted protein [Laccaria bicolor S238N-H82]|eukprot:XP_001882206.1 predicted protein [Laccaria bicolor S238N-H82]